MREDAPKPIWEITDESWKLGIDVNLSTAFYCSRAVSKHMVDRGSGKIVNVSSGYGFRGGRNNYMYAAGVGIAVAGAINYVVNRRLTFGIKF